MRLLGEVKTSALNRWLGLTAMAFVATWRAAVSSAKDVDDIDGWRKGKCLTGLHWASRSGRLFLDLNDAASTRPSPRIAIYGRPPTRPVPSSVEYFTERYPTSARLIEELALHPRFA